MREEVSKAVHTRQDSRASLSRGGGAIFNTKIADSSSVVSCAKPNIQASDFSTSRLFTLPRQALDTFLFS